MTGPGPPSDRDELDALAQQLRTGGPADQHGAGGELFQDLDVLHDYLTDAVSSTSTTDRDMAVADLVADTLDRGEADIAGDTGDEQALERLEVIRAYLEEDGPQQELSFAAQVAAWEQDPTPEAQQQLEAVRVELEQFLGQSSSAFHSVADMVATADDMLATVLDTDPRYGAMHSDDDDLQNDVTFDEGTSLSH